jgi:hypothetical protein
MRIAEFAASRIVGAVVHGTDGAPAPGSPYFAAADGIATTATILDNLQAWRTTGRRPAGQSDDMDWILAAPGRAASGGNRLPPIG